MREPLPPAQPGAVAHLEIADVVARRVLHHLVGDPLDRLGALEQRDGVLEPLEIVLEIGRVVHQHEPAELHSGPVSGSANPACAGQLDHRLRPERAVEMGVQLRLGQPADQLTREHRRSSAVRRALTTTRRIEPSASGASGGTSIPRASVT